MVPQEKIIRAWDLEFIPTGSLGWGLGAAKMKPNWRPEGKVGRSAVRCNASMVFFFKGSTLP